MAAADRPRPAVESPELALVDPELRTGARPILAREDGTPSRETGSSPQGGRAAPLATSIGGSVLEDPVLRDAVRRLNELSELEPPARPRRSAKLLSLSFALAAWVTLVILVADGQPWRV